MSRPYSLTPEAVKQIRDWAATPLAERRTTRIALAMRFRVSEHTITRAAHGQRSYAKVVP